jgi:ornithine carbamoyltransferase
VHSQHATVPYPAIPDSPTTMSPRDLTTVLTVARSLQHAAHTGADRPPLRGKNIGLLCEHDGNADATLFRRAAEELGARVSHIRSTLSDKSTPQEIQHTARLLGRLYDAVECQGLPAALIQQIGAVAGVPIYDGAATGHHPSAQLAGLLGGGCSADDNRRFVLQAVLLSTIA